MMRFPAFAYSYPPDSNLCLCAQSTRLHNAMRGLEPMSVRSIFAARTWSALTSRFAPTNSSRLPPDSNLWSQFDMVACLRCTLGRLPISLDLRFASSATGSAHLRSPHDRGETIDSSQLLQKPRKNRSMKDLFFLGGISRTRTYDPHDVNVVL